MTLVNAETGELECSAEEARHLTDQIKGAVTKVGRRWFTATRNDVRSLDTQFSLVDGLEKSEYGTRRRLVTGEMAAHLDRVQAAWRTLEAWGLQKRGYGQFPDDHLLLIVDRLGEPPVTS